jgi:hypothetical protein
VPESRHSFCGAPERVTKIGIMQPGAPWPEYCPVRSHGLEGAVFRGNAGFHILERNLVLDLLDAETGRRLVLDDETLDLVVREIARPDDRNVAPSRVSDPPLLTIENPGVALALSFFLVSTDMTGSFAARNAVACVLMY